uniref:AMP-binding domain-containing protein n=1 Tax=Panagrellus redivivus TaxID=6233 RepID=A0A7E4UV43_PANRE
MLRCFRLVGFHRSTSGITKCSNNRLKYSVTTKRSIHKSPLEPVPIETQNFGIRMLETLWKHGRADPKKKAFICAENPNISLTYRQAFTRCQSVAAFFESQGLRHGDVACIVLPNSWEFFEILVGASSRGIGVTTASMLYTEYELSRQFVDSKAKIVFCGDKALDRVMKAAKTAKTIEKIVVLQVSDREQDLPKGLPDGVIRYNKVIETMPNLNSATVKVDVKKDIVILPYSSGTTGPPKGVMLSHQAFSTMLSVFTTHYSKYVYPRLDPNWQIQKEPMLLFNPMYHIYGIGLLCVSIIMGQTGVVMNHFDKHVFYRSIQDYKIRHLFIVPPILVHLVNDPAVDEYDVSSLEFVLTGGAPTGVDFCKKAIKRLPNLKRIDQGYGMTECSCWCTQPVIEDSNPIAETVGTLMANYEAKIIDSNGNELPPGEPGELLIRSPTLMTGYFAQPKATADSLDSEGWFHTGDLIRIDEKQRLFVLDRMKELIKVKGYQVAPAELEDLLLSHHDISDAAVVGVPHEKNGEAPYAFIVRKNPLLTETQIHEFVKEKVAYYKQLNGGIQFVDSIPKSPSGKILRRILRDSLRNK